jgi:hypothetical protein
MARTLRKVHAGSPLRTNASINRDRAIECFKAGMTVEQIASEWPEVFQVTIEDGQPRLGQRYDYELADGSGRFETKRTITSASVKAAIARYQALNPSR